MMTFPYAPSGRREVAEEVVKAGLIALVTGLLNWGLEQLKERAKARGQQGEQQS